MFFLSCAHVARRSENTVVAIPVLLPGKTRLLDVVRMRSFAGVGSRASRVQGAGIANCHKMLHLGANPHV